MSVKGRTERPNNLRFSAHACGGIYTLNLIKIGVSLIREVKQDEYDAAVWKMMTESNFAGQYSLAEFFAEVMVEPAEESVERIVAMEQAASGALAAAKAALKPPQRKPQGESREEGGTHSKQTRGKETRARRGKKKQFVNEPSVSPVQTDGGDDRSAADTGENPPKTDGPKRKEGKVKHNEKEMPKHFIAYINALLAYMGADAGNAVDTHTTQFRSLDGGDKNHTSPDLVFSRPGVAVEKIRHFGAAILAGEFKVDIEIVKSKGKDKGKLRYSRRSQDARTQMAKNARNLFIASQRGRVYIISVSKTSQTRIFCFDRAGFIATEEFDWLEDSSQLATFCFRLFNISQANPTRPPCPESVDDTISNPDSATTDFLWKATRAHEFYATHEDMQDEAKFKAACLDIIAARRVDADGRQELIHCLTVGPVIFISDSIFGRATRVYRVVIKSDLDAYHAAPADNKPELRFYALKDAWREDCRRPEVEFYDFIENYCMQLAEPRIDMDEAGMARCIGSLDLSQPGKSGVNGDWDVRRHVTQFGASPDKQRRHTRTLLTPVGRDLATFDCQKDLVATLYNAVKHLMIAYDAGLVHRDVSNGNVMLVEARPGTPGFLCDWDYAEFTKAGVESFNQLRASVPRFKNYRMAKWDEVKKSLKDFTGTFYFMAVEMLETQGYKKPTADTSTTVTAPNQHPVRHDLRHDLESVYWLLLWYVLRNTAHNHPEREHACDSLFFEDGANRKPAWFSQANYEVPVHPTWPMHQVVQGLDIQVIPQIFRPPAHAHLINFTWTRSPIVPENFANVFKSALDTGLWKTDDKSIPYSLVESRVVVAGGRAYRESVEVRSYTSRSERVTSHGSTKRGADSSISRSQRQRVTSSTGSAGSGLSGDDSDEDDQEGNSSYEE
ncbi:Protein kinase domain-containing protein [Mycena kentingensis (nom. inval.)]|nr:Protein kinase domain-containing protein [Mycena kentingensis (nom. inval.)]